MRSKFDKDNKLADTYVNSKGKKCFKGNRRLKNSAAYPPAFGREVPCPLIYQGSLVDLLKAGTSRS